ncbi:MAG: hypothetical protein JW395_3727 [Nitrospira sp.]|nr:hypothetical protein [Nitrospira sp.]
MYELDIGVEGSSKVLRSNAHQTAKFSRRGKLIRVRMPFPVADFGNPLREPEPNFTLDQGVQGAAAAQHIPHTIT